MGEIVSLLFRLLISMTVVIGLMMLAARVANKRRGPMLRRSNDLAGIEVLARHGLSKNASLVIARAGGKTMVLGVTDASITKLDDIVSPKDVTLSLIDDDEVKAGPDANWTAYSGSTDVDIVSFGQSRKGMIEQLREMTLRRS